jgi:tripeptide aminopeptidase
MARSHDPKKLDAQLDAMRTACEAAATRHGAGIDFSSEEIYRTYRIEDDAPPYREAAWGIRALGLDVMPRKSGGGTDGNLFNAKGMRCVGLPTGMVDEHATSEHISIDDMVTACQIMVVSSPDAPTRRSRRKRRHSQMRTSLPCEAEEGHPSPAGGPACHPDGLGGPPRHNRRAAMQ